MREFLYRFGYEAPADLATNSAGGDQESCGYFRIAAQTEEDALAWGHRLAFWYVQRLFGESEVERWSPTGFATWIEYSPNDILKEGSANISAVAASEFPDFEELINAFGD